MADPFDPLAYPDRLNLGCGWDIREGFLNVDLHDFHGPQLVADVTNLPMLPSGHYVEVVAQDVLEHLPRQSTVDVLREWSRLLKTGGTLELRVPSVLGIARLMKAPEYQTIPQQELMVQCLFGTQAYTEDCHYTTFTEPLLRHYLAEAGLEPTTFEIRDGWLFEVIAGKPQPGTERTGDPFGTDSIPRAQESSDSPTPHASGAPSASAASFVSVAAGRSLPLARGILRRGRERARAALQR